MCPDLRIHLVNLGVPDHTWISKWFMMVFLLTLPLEMVVRIWDFVLSEETSLAILKIALALIKFIRLDLIKLTEIQEILEYFKILKEETGSTTRSTLTTTSNNKKLNKNSDPINKNMADNNRNPLENNNKFGENSKNSNDNASIRRTRFLRAEKLIREARKIKLPKKTVAQIAREFVRTYPIFQNHILIQFYINYEKMEKWDLSIFQRRIISYYLQEEKKFDNKNREENKERINLKLELMEVNGGKETEEFEGVLRNIKVPVFKINFQKKKEQFHIFREDGWGEEEIESEEGE
jgi:hypothetical protein